MVDELTFTDVDDQHIIDKLKGTRVLDPIPVEFCWALARIMEQMKRGRTDGKT